MGFKDYQGASQEQNKAKQCASDVQNFYNMYKGKSEDELLEELTKHVAKQKQDGTFNYNSLCAMLNKVSPFLSNEQKTKMKEILENLK